MLFRSSGFLLVSCAPLNKLVKAKATTPSAGFLNFQATPVVETARSPWHSAAFSGDRKALALAAGRRQIFIAPVETRGLRPISTALAGKQYAAYRTEHAGEIAKTLRREFARAIASAPGTPWQILTRPTVNCLRLELNLIELDPTSASGNVAKTIVKYTLSPVAAFGVGLFTGGKIAIEGRLRDGQTGKILLQFADREKDKATIYNARDYTALGHSSRTAREWAEQFSAFLYNRQRPVKDSFFLTPMLY